MALTITREEWVVIGVVLLVLALMEAGPKLLNYIKNRRSDKPTR
jgi:hypothetical protein